MSYTTYDWGMNSRYYRKQREEEQREQRNAEQQRQQQQRQQAHAQRVKQRAQRVQRNPPPFKRPAGVSGIVYNSLLNAADRFFG